jgi:ribonucleoside-triphosphate reductase
MGNQWYNEPKTLDAVFDVISDITFCGSSQQYGGFTLPNVEKVLRPYAEKSFKIYVDKYTERFAKYGVPQDKIEEAALEDVENDFEQGFQGWECRFNTVSSSRGDYPFITTTFGNGTSLFEKMAIKAILKVRQGGQGKEGFKKPVLFPKLVFLYDENLHGAGKEHEDLFDAAIECISKTMYPHMLSLTGDDTLLSAMYKKYGKVYLRWGVGLSLLLGMKEVEWSLRMKMTSLYLPVALI